LPASQQPAAQQPAAQEPAAQQPAVEEPAVDESTIEPVIPEGSQTYIVQDGDTLWDIATEFGTTVDAIILANALDNPSDIQIDQELTIPPPDEDAAASEEEAPVDDGTTDEGIQ
jgi:LysM repeat protein